MMTGPTRSILTSTGFNAKLVAFKHQVHPVGPITLADDLLGGADLATLQRHRSSTSRSAALRSTAQLSLEISGLGIGHLSMADRTGEVRE